MRKIKLYLADLTHDTVGIATDTFPLNVGYIGAYAMSRFPDQLDISIYKYITDLEQAILDAPPDILALSNYPWCEQADREMMTLLDSLNPDAIRILGGPNFPHDGPSQIEFLKGNPLVDAYVYMDGEVGFANILERCVGKETAAFRTSVRDGAIPGCIYLDDQGQLVFGGATLRNRELDEIPSPYLTGLMDPFFDGRLIPMIQTNRGCPFKCTFCFDGQSLSNKVVHFSIERVAAELRYIAGRVPENMRSLLISDLNFGMYKRDADICQVIADINKEQDYPHYVECTTGKNSKERVMSAIRKLDKMIGLTMAVQTMEPEVLKNIKRDNIATDQLVGLKQAIQEAGLPATSELILALPGESKETHLRSLQNLLVAEMDYVTSYTLIMVNGSELATPAERKKWGYETKYRVIPRDFTKLQNGRTIVEVEEVVVSTNSLSFEDYLDCRRVAFFLPLLNTQGARALSRFLIQNDIALIDVILGIIDKVQQRDPEDTTSPYYVLGSALDNFIRETREELWDSADELRAFFQDHENFDGLVDGTYGANLLQTYAGRIFAHGFKDLITVAIHEVTTVLDERNVDEEIRNQLRDVERFVRGRTFNLLTEDRSAIVLESHFSYDIDAWVADPESQPLSDYKIDREKLMKFVITKNQFRTVEDVLDRFGHNDLGRGKAGVRLTLDRNVLWRSVVTDDSLDKDIKEQSTMLIENMPLAMGHKTADMKKSA